MTSLPVDYNKRPWKGKYLTEETPVLNYWMIFGKFSDGTVGISDSDQDIFEHVPENVAKEIVEARNTFCDKIEEIFCTFKKDESV